MRFLVTSASGANGDGYGALLTFGSGGEFLGPFSSDPRIADPRGFGFGRDGRLYLASGATPSGGGDNTIAVFGRAGTLCTPGLVTDTELSPLDLAIAPRFGRPRGLRFGPGGRLYCVAEDQVAAFDLAAGSFAGPVVQFTRLNGQALVLIP